MSDILPGFVQWLERKDPNERYEWPRSEICACGQYAKEIGVNDWVNKPGWTELNLLAHGDSCLGESRPDAWTFGKLLDRARARLQVIA